MNAPARSHRAALDKVSDRASCCRACGRILAPVELHPRAVVGFRMARWRKDVEPSRPAVTQPVRGFLVANAEVGEGGGRRKGDDGEGCSGGDDLRRKGWVKVGNVKPGELGHNCRIE